MTMTNQMGMKKGCPQITRLNALLGRTKVMQCCIHRDKKVLRGRKLTSDRDATKTEPGLDVQDVVDDVVWREHDRVGDESVLVSLDSADHLRLRLRRLVVMNYTNSAEELHVRHLYVNIQR